MKSVKNVNVMKSVNDIIEKHKKDITREKNKRYINEDRETYETRKWREELKEYNKKNKTDVKFCYEKTENKRYAVNRGIHTMEFQKEFWKQEKKKCEKKNIPILLYKNGVGILGIARKIRWNKDEKEIRIEFEYEKVKENVNVEKRNLYDLEEKMVINEKEYKIKDIEILLMKNHFEIYEIM